MEPRLQRGDSLLDRGQAPVESFALIVIGRSQVADRLRDTGGCLLPPSGHLPAGDLSAADDVVKQALGTLARLGRGPGGCREGPFDRRSERVSDPFGAARRFAPGVVVP